MSVDISRRNLLKLAVLFAGAWAVERTQAMDAAPRYQPVGAEGAARGSASGQNGWAVDGSSNFLAVYRDPALKAAFFLFLQNVYHIYPEDRFHRLIEEACAVGATDKEIYAYGQSRIADIRPVLADVRYALPALSKQKKEMVRQTLDLLSAQRKVNGYLEIGTTGRYVGGLQSQLELSGDIVLVNTDAPSYSPTDVIERGGIKKVGRFVALKDYDPIAAADVADQSMDLVTNFIGFHHAPPSRRDDFVKSLHRVLRPGGKLILRDHDVDSQRMNRIVALAHDVFNMGLGTDWHVNQTEIRNFTSLRETTRYLEAAGFKPDRRALAQHGDPTQNMLMIFTKV